VRFLVDNQLPIGLARHLAAHRHDTVHVLDVSLADAPDRRIWQWSIEQARIVISKDEDFFSLANQVGDRGQLLWIRLGNCRKPMLIDAIDRSMEQIEAAFASGQRIVEIA